MKLIGRIRNENDGICLAAISELRVFGLLVSLFTEAGNITVIISIPDANLGADTSICSDLNQSIELNPGPGYISYLWNDGSINQQLTIDSKDMNAGIYTYYVTVTDVSGCVGSDTILIEILYCTGVEEVEKDLKSRFILIQIMVNSCWNLKILKAIFCK